ncbi:MAG TPA: mevalonate kinase [Myxococcales bacterium]|nr:mevalonate kinase [Myxococcales bacterium]
MSRGHGSAPGKVILLGEHAVVYGHPALAASLGQRIFVEMEDDEGGPRVEIGGVPGREDSTAPGSPQELNRAFAAMAAELGVDPRLRAKVWSELPLGGGLGSSAALGVALARALCEILGQACPPDRAAALALHFERIFHGAPSGVDPAVCARGGLLVFTRAMEGRPESIEPVSPPAPVYLVVALTGIARGTRRTVLPLAERKAARPSLYDPLLATLGDLARGGKDALLRGDLADLGVRFDAAHGILSALGVSCVELDEITAALRKDGALGAKLTGGGGGGAAIALASDAAHAGAMQGRLGGRGTTGFVAKLG